MSLPILHLTEGWTISSRALKASEACQLYSHLLTIHAVQTHGPLWQQWTWRYYNLESFVEIVWWVVWLPYPLQKADSTRQSTHITWQYSKYLNKRLCNQSATTLNNDTDLYEWMLWGTYIYIFLVQFTMVATFRKGRKYQRLVKHVDWCKWERSPIQVEARKPWCLFGCSCNSIITLPFALPPCK